MPNELAPIAIFAYKRPEHVRRLIGSLKANKLFALSAIYAFCDGPRGPKDAAAVSETRAVLRVALPDRAQIVESETNRGLARSIIHGVSLCCAAHGRVIVLEDDLVLSPHFLDFVNAALDRYADEPRVYHVSGYRYPVPLAEAPQFFRLPCSWGWATWDRAWAHFDPDVNALEVRLRKEGLVWEFDVGGSFPFFRMLQRQARGKVDSWAIRWYASVFLRQGLAIYPNISQVLNGGFDGTGEHCGHASAYDVALGRPSLNWPAEVMEDQDHLQWIRSFFQSETPTLSQRIHNKLRRLADMVPQRRAAS